MPEENQSNTSTTPSEVFAIDDQQGPNAQQRIRRTIDMPDVDSHQRATQCVRRDARRLRQHIVECRWEGWGREWQYWNLVPHVHVHNLRTFPAKIEERSMPRQRKTTDQHKQNHTYRPSRHANRNPLPIAEPLKPADLTPGASLLWDEIVSMGLKSERIACLDGLAVRLLSESLELYSECSRLIAEHGLLLTHRSKNGERFIVNPAIRARAAAWTQVVTLAAKFGFSPADRKVLGLFVGAVPNDGDDDEDAADAILGPIR